MKKKTLVYLVYDFEELCGVFSSFSCAKNAVARHLEYLKKYVEKKARQLGFGEIEFEIFEEGQKNRWIYAVLAKSKSGKDIHRRKIVIIRKVQNSYDSTIKRLAERC
ncbi:MAG: hypothetical protein N3G80_04425 [Candidatus Micrarchaeota archaeon]|nr:hypothetical protein [Candidatus Micrarchaeota archaeon]